MTTQELLSFEQVSEEEGEGKTASGLHAGIGGVITGALYAYLEQHPIGRVLNSSATYNFNDNLPRREPDVSFISLERMAELLDEEINLAPDLAVEVVSKNDKIYEADDKVKQYQAAGVSLIWIVRPRLKVVEVYRLPEGPIARILGLEDELNGENILPGFKLLVSKLFNFPLKAQEKSVKELNFDK